MNIKSPNYADIPLLRKLWQEAFGDTDEFLDLFFAHGFAPDRCRFIEADGSAAAMLYWFDCDYKGAKIAYIYAVATAKTHRSKGFCRQLMEHTHNHMKINGYTGAILVPSSPSLFEFYKSIGYETSCFVHEFTCNADAGKVNLSKISGEEYVTLRRNFLDDDSVIQENENLRFLSSYAEFFKTNDGILAAYKESHRLISFEILGDISKAPRIVSALGCTYGTFRTKGDNKPFAMYLPLDQHISPPTYFGFAFD